MAKVLRGTKIEISKQLTQEAATTFAKWIGCYCVIWNCKVAENKQAYSKYLTAKQQGKSAVIPKVNQRVAHFITEERSWLKEVPSQIRRNAGTKCIEAIRACIKKLRSAPRFKHSNGIKYCLVTNELFDITEDGSELMIACKTTNKSNPFINLRVPRDNNMLGLPKMLWVSRQGSRFWVSFSYEKQLSAGRSSEKIIEQLAQSPKSYQESAVLGIDVGVKKPIMSSVGIDFGYTSAEQASLARKEKRRKYYQKIMSRKRKQALANNGQTGKNYRKVSNQYAQKSAQIGKLRINMAHRISKQVAANDSEVVVCEDLNIQNMTKRSKPKRDEKNKKWLPNQAKAKAGLNKSILNVAWGRIQNYLEYKLRERDKLLVKIPAHYSSQECAHCSHISAANRPTQAKFVCQSCGHQSNADHNSAKVLKKRFLAQLRTGTFVVKTKTAKRISVRRNVAVRSAVTACGADIRPLRVGGSGDETGTFKSDLRS